MPHRSKLPKSRYAAVSNCAGSGRARIPMIVIALATAACATKVEIQDDDGGAGARPPAPYPTGPGQPPPPPSQPTTPDPVAQHLYAVRRLFVGDTDRNGLNDPSAWRRYGFNLDAKLSTAASTDVCVPAAGGPKAVHDDGNDGIDNAWGKVMVPIMQGLSSGLSASVDQSIASGDIGYLFRAGGLGDQSNYAGLDVTAYVGAPTLPPAWNGLDVWPPSYESFDANLAPRWRFAASYTNGHTLVTAPAGAFVFELDIQGFTMVLPLERTIISMDVSPDRGTASNGTIAGILRTEAFVEEMRKVAGSFDLSLCTGATFDSLADQLRQSSDMVADGPQDPGKTCDAISVGLGFDAVEVQLGAVAAPAPPPLDPCLDPPPPLP